MVKFRKSAVNAKSRDQQVDISSAYLVRQFSLYLGLRLEMAMTESVGPRPEPCTIGPSGISGTEGRVRGRLDASNDYMGYMGERRKFPHLGLGLRPRSRRNFEHLIPNGVHFGLLFASQFSKVGGDGPKLFESWGTRPTGPIGWLHLCLGEQCPEWVQGQSPWSQVDIEASPP